MTEENHTIRLLIEMRKDMREGFERVTGRFAQVDGELEKAKADRFELRKQMNDLRKRMVEGETRLATELIAVSGAIQEAKGLIMQQGALKFVVQDHETRLRKIEAE